MSTGEFNVRGNPAMDLHPIQEGFKILLVALCYRNWEKLSGLMGHLVFIRTFTFALVKFCTDVSDPLSYRLPSAFQAC